MDGIEIDVIVKECIGSIGINMNRDVWSEIIKNLWMWKRVIKLEEDEIIKIRRLKKVFLV